MSTKKPSNDRNKGKIRPEDDPRYLDPDVGADPNREPGMPRRYVVGEDFLKTHAETLRQMQGGVKAPAKAAQVPKEEAQEQAFHSLTPRQKALAYRGSKENLKGTTELPGTIRIMSITCKAKHLHLVNTWLTQQGKSLPMQDNLFMGDGNPEELVTTYHEIPHINNAFSIYRDAEHARMQIAIRAVESDRVGLIRAGLNTASLHPHLESEQKQGETIGETTLYHSDPSGRIKKITGPIDTSREPQFFGKVSSLTKDSITSARSEEHDETPQMGYCEYIVIDPRNLTNVKGVDIITGQMSTPAASEDILFEQWNGYIVVASTDERAGWNIREIAKQLSLASEQNAIIWYGDGEFEAHDGGGYSIKEFPTKEKLQHMASEAQILQNTGSDDLRIFTPNKGIGDINKGRRSTGNQITEVEAVEGADFSVIKKMKSEIKLRVGGPDKLIGYEEELENLLEATNPATRNQRLTILAGQAGTGKSRLLDELRQQRKTITISFDPSRRKVPFGQLAMAAEQIAEQIKPTYIALAKAYQKETDPEKKADLGRKALRLQNIIKYSKKSQKDRLAEANNNPEAVSHMCHIAIATYEMIYGGFTLIVDDVHHTDRFSDSHVMGLVSNFLENGNSKVVMAMRPEERHQSPQQAQLERRFSKWVNRISIEGLDFKTGLESENPETDSLAYQFIFHTIPSDKRINSEGETRKLGNWFKELASWANTPLELSDYMDEILSSPRNLIVSENQIDLKDGVLDSIKAKGGGKDTQQYNINKIKELTKNERAVLTALSMLSSTISSSQLQVIIRDVLKIKTATTPEETLIQKGLLLDSDTLDGQDGLYKLKHDTLRKTILSSVSDTEKRSIASKLQRHFAADPSISADIQLGIAQHNADNTPLTNTQFWKQYITNANATLDEAEEFEQYSRAYGWASTILGEDRKARTTINHMILLMQKGRRVAPAMRSLIEKAIMTKARNALAIGREQEVYDAEELFGSINPDATKYKEVLLYAFEAAYSIGAMRSSKTSGALADQYRRKLIRLNLTPAEEFTVRLKSGYKAAGHDSEKIAQVKKLYETLVTDSLEGAPEKDKHHAERIYLRIQFEEIRTRIQGTKVDDDTLMEPSQLTEEEISKLFVIKNGVDKMLTIGKNNAETMSPIDELTLLELKAQVEAFLGHYHTRASESTTPTSATSEFERIPLPSISHGFDGASNGLPTIELEASSGPALELDLGDDAPAHLRESQPDSAETEPTQPEMAIPTEPTMPTVIEAPTPEQLSENIQDMGSIEALGECWRLAMQMEFYSNAARAAKMRGDLQVMKAMSVQTEYRNSNTPGKLNRSGAVDKRELKRAIDTYGNGLEALGSNDPESQYYPLNIDENNFYHVGLRINRIRAIGKLCEASIPELLEAYQEAKVPGKSAEGLKEIVEELKPYIEMAFEDYKFINSSKKWGNRTYSENPEMNYYLSYIGPALYASLGIMSSEKLTGVKLENPIMMEQRGGLLPYLSAVSIWKGIEHFKEMNETELGEVNDKASAIGRLIQAGQAWTQAKHLRDTSTGKRMSGDFTALNKELRTAVEESFTAPSS